VQIGEARATPSSAIGSHNMASPLSSTGRSAQRTSSGSWVSPLQTNSAQSRTSRPRTSSRPRSAPRLRTPNSAESFTEITTFTQEVRLAGALGERFDYLIGGTMPDEDIRELQSLTLGSTTRATSARRSPQLRPWPEPGPQHLRRRRSVRPAATPTISSSRTAALGRSSRTTPSTCQPDRYQLRPALLRRS